MWNIRGWEWIIILVIILLLLGPSKIPGLAKALGKSVSAFRGGVKEGRDETSDAAQDDAVETKEPEKT
jgi:sec-independent protein translocase protein TatA